jgi:hypothetical protein
VLFCHITTRLKDRKNDDLLGRKGGQGFPYIVAMDAEGRVTAVWDYQGASVDAFRAVLTKGAAYAAKKAAKDLPTADAVELFLHDLACRNITLAEARDAAAAMKGLDAGQRKTVDGALVATEVFDVLGRFTTGSDAEKQAAGKAFAEMWAAGRAPALEDDRVFQQFYGLILDYARAQKDAALFGKSLEVIRKKFTSDSRFSGNPKAVKWLADQDARLKELKGE